MYKLICHRGFHDCKIKENSLQGIKIAFKDDAYVGVEFDVRLTKDNEFVVFHDAYYNNKLIKNTYYKELPKYVPKLEDVLKIKSNKIFLIEVKNIENKYNKFIKLLGKYQDKNIYVMSFSNKIISKLNIENRNYKLGILNYILNTTELIHELDFIGILNSLLNDSILEKLSNLEILSYGLFENLKYEDIYYIVDNK